MAKKSSYFIIIFYFLFIFWVTGITDDGYMQEMIVFVGSLIATVAFLISWYGTIGSNWPKKRNRLIKNGFRLLPLIAFIIIIYTLKNLAAFDVVGDSFYLLFYILLGFAWIFISLTLFAYFFDLSWKDDALQLGNKAAAISLAGAFIGTTLIYSGANIGDGPGWWCVIFAGGIGLFAWIGLGILINAVTQVFEKVSVERDLGSGIRFGSYLVASGLILARASAGDWTSFFKTLEEFLVGWPVLILVIIAILVERYFSKHDVRIDEFERKEISLTSSVVIGILYIVIGIVVVVLLPTL